MQAAPRTAAVVGAGPNGLAAAITLAQAGASVIVYEAEAIPGGAARTLELTLPGFHHDFGSAVHPMAAGSPFFRTLPLADYGLEWIHSPGRAGTSVGRRHRGAAGAGYRRAMPAAGKDGPAGGAYWSRCRVTGGRWPRTFCSRFLRCRGILCCWPAWAPAAHCRHRCWRGWPSRVMRARRFAGVAAHSFLGPSQPFSASFGIVMAAAAHAVGWPIPRGGSQAITDALIAYLRSLGGVVQTSTPVERLEDLGAVDVTLCDTTPRQLLRMAGPRLHSVDRRRFERFRPGPGVFKVDYALSEPIPWRAKDCALAATVHVGGDTRRSRRRNTR